MAYGNMNPDAPTEKKTKRKKFKSEEDPGATMPKQRMGRSRQERIYQPRPSMGGMKVGY